MGILSPHRTQAMQAIAERGFAPDHAAFLSRLEHQRRTTRETAEVAKAHLGAFAERMRRAMDALNQGQLGSARAYLEIGQRDYQAALNCLPR
jgi:hypothetical protein